MNINIFFLHNLPQKGHQAPYDSKEKRYRTPISVFEQNKIPQDPPPSFDDSINLSSNILNN